jgi:hypothetical protein
MLPTPETKPMMSAKEVADAYGIGINAVYAEARRYLDSEGADGIPALRFGRTIRFPTASIRKQLHLDS